MDALSIGIIGDYDPEKISHPETIGAIQHAAAHLSVEVTVDWIASTDLATGDAKDLLSPYDGLFASPGFYENVEGGVSGIHYARESGKPFVGT